MTKPRSVLEFLDDFIRIDNAIRELDPKEDWKEISALVADQAELHGLASMQLDDRQFFEYQKRKAKLLDLCDN